MYNIKETSEKLDKSIDFFIDEIKSVRTGRANTILVEDIKVDVFGQNMKVKEVASLTVPDAMSIVVAPWDKSNLKPIEEAINNANLGVGVVNNGENIRVVLPELSVERREEMKKVIDKKAEESKVTMRNIRRDAIDNIKKSEKNKEISEDDRKRLEKEIQDSLDKKTKELDNIVDSKKTEISN
jgi:ribosome recycling factor